MTGKSIPPAMGSLESTLAPAPPGRKEERQTMTTRRLLAALFALTAAAFIAFLAIPAAIAQTPKDPVALLAKRFDLADKLLGEGEREQAFAHYLWCADRAQALGLPEQNLRAIRAMIGLGAAYPAAVEALRERRDFAEEKILSGRGDHDVAWSFALLNREFGDEARTLAALDQLPSGDRSNRSVRRALASFIYPTLVERRRYEAAADTLDAEGLASLAEPAALLDAFEVLLGAGETSSASALAERLLARDESVERRAELIARAIRADHPDMARALAENAWLAAGSAGERERVMAAAASIPGGFKPPVQPTPRPTPTPTPRPTPRPTPAAISPPSMPDPIETRPMIASAAPSAHSPSTMAPSGASSSMSTSPGASSEPVRSTPVEPEPAASSSVATQPADSSPTASAVTEVGDVTSAAAMIAVDPGLMRGIDVLGWMAGEWTASVGGNPYVEYWMPPAGNTMCGTSRLVTQKGSFIEFFQLEQRADGSVWFLVNINRRTGFEHFRAVEATEERLALENPENDFPKRIVYEKTPTGMQALLFDSTGDHAAKKPGMTYAFRRNAMN
jgi:hypothetical protein